MGERELSGQLTQGGFTVWKPEMMDACGWKRRENKVGSGSGTARLIKFVAWMTQPTRGLGVGSDLTRHSDLVTYYTSPWFDFKNGRNNIKQYIEASPSIAPFTLANSIHINATIPTAQSSLTAR